MPNKNLYIGLSADRILIASKEEGSSTLSQEKQIAVGYNQSPLGTLLDHVKLSSYDYKIVYCSVKNPFFVLIPEILFDASNPSKYLTGVDLNGQKVLVDKIARNGVYCVYPIEQSSYEKLVHTYPNIILRHFASVLIDLTVKTGYSEQKIVVSVDVEDGLFYLCISNKTDLLLCNKFAFKSPEDILYFILYSLEQFTISPSSCEIHLSGAVGEHSASVVLLNEYFENLVIQEANPFLPVDFKHQTAFFHQDACV